MGIYVTVLVYNAPLLVLLLYSVHALLPLLWTIGILSYKDRLELRGVWKGIPLAQACGLLPAFDFCYRCGRYGRFHSVTARCKIVHQ